MAAIGGPLYFMFLAPPPPPLTILDPMLHPPEPVRAIWQRSHGLLKRTVINAAVLLVCRIVSSGAMACGASVTRINVHTCNAVVTWLFRELLTVVPPPRLQLSLRHCYVGCGFGHGCTVCEGDLYVWGSSSLGRSETFKILTEILFLLDGKLELK